ncbi:hypothetical protein CR513_23543, partial [Mucuna pruriens]
MNNYHHNQGEGHGETKIFMELWNLNWRVGIAFFLCLPMSTLKIMPHSQTLGEKPQIVDHVRGVAKCMESRRRF